jgi:uncharacterized protein (TIGR03435 family)
MPDVNDMDLIREYADCNSEPAFAALVQQHINLVYSAALRYAGNSADAQDVTQAVFVILAQKAAGLRQRTTLTGWLYEATRLTARQLLRTRARRQVREQEACMESTLNDAETENVWRQLAPLLEEAMTRLNEKERTLLALRYFENKSGAEAAALLGLREWAVHKRTARALEKLRKFFTKRGVVSTTAIIAGAVSAHSVQAAPAALAQSVTVAAVSKGVVASASTLTLIKGALKLMAWTKAKTAVVSGVVVLLAAGMTTVAVKGIQEHKMYSWRVNGITRADVTKLGQWPAQVWIAPAKDTHAGNQLGKGKHGELMGRNTPFSWLLRNAYGKTQVWMVLPSDVTDTRGFDYMANLPEHSADALQMEINRTFGMTVRREIRETNVLILKIANTGARAMIPSTATSGRELAGKDTLTWIAQPLSTLNVFLEDFFHTPIVDQTGLSQKYDFAVQWDEQWWFNNRDDPQGLQQKLLDQLGLELVPTNMPIEMLVVEKAKN